MSRRLCILGLVLVLLAGSVPALAQAPQVDPPADTTSWWTTLLSSWLDGVLSLVAGGASDDSEVESQTPELELPADPQSPSTSLTEEEKDSTERGGQLEPSG